jgi:hypothetical protein
MVFGLDLANFNQSLIDVRANDISVDEVLSPSQILELGGEVLISQVPNSTASPLTTSQKTGGSGTKPKSKNSAKPKNSAQSQNSTAEQTALKVARDFTLSVYNEQNKIDKVFYFSLMPAIQSNLPGEQVAEVKPGILKRTTQNLKTFNLPGGLPAVQVLGLSPGILQIVGLLVGSEWIEQAKEGGSFFEKSVPKIQALAKLSKEKGAIYNSSAKLDAVGYADLLDVEFIQFGRPCKLDIVVDNKPADIPAIFKHDVSSAKDPVFKLSYRVLIQDIRYLYKRLDRVAYSMNAIILNYLGE